MNANSDQVILVGAASKGIIQRNFQHNAMVYKTPYAKNPFDAVTDEEIEYYKNSVEKGTGILNFKSLNYLLKYIMF